MSAVSKYDDLIQTATALLKQRYAEGRHHIAAALITPDGEVFQGLHLEATVGRVAVCAEAVALGAACSAGASSVEAIVAVNKAGQVISPCGICRELISDYAPSARVIVPRPDGPAIAEIGELLPLKYRRD